MIAHRLQPGSPGLVGADLYSPPALPAVQGRFPAPAATAITLLALVLIDGTTGLFMGWTLKIALSAAVIVVGSTGVCRLAGKPFTARLAGWFIPRVMGALDKEFRAVRAELLRNVHGNILDLGAGAGHYFRYTLGPSPRQSPVTSVTALEPNPHLHGALRTMAARAAAASSSPPSTQPAVTICAKFIENVPGAALFDFVILGNVLCEVPDPVFVLHHVNRLLKPGGTVYFCEHVAASPGTWHRRVQDFVQPWWGLVSDGCHCNRELLHAIESVPEWRVCSWAYDPAAAIPVLGKFQVGLATKDR